jgi:hypothetical protein
MSVGMCLYDISTSHATASHRISVTIGLQRADRVDSLLSMYTVDRLSANPSNIIPRHFGNIRQHRPSMAQSSHSVMKISANLECGPSLLSQLIGHLPHATITCGSFMRPQFVSLFLVIIENYDIGVRYTPLH